MALKSATPYLLFHGRAREAIALYEKALGAKVVSLMRFGDVDQSCPEATKDRVMHCVLQIGAATIFLGDGIDLDAPPQSTLNIALDYPNLEEGQQAFAALSDGGNVVKPLAKAPWGAHFGALSDAFGVPWMFNVDGS